MIVIYGNMVTQWSFSEVSQCVTTLRLPRKDRYQLIITQTARAKVKNLRLCPSVKQETWLKLFQFVQVLQCLKMR